MTRIPRFPGGRYFGDQSNFGRYQDSAGELVQQAMAPPVAANPLASGVLGRRETLPRVNSGGGNASFQLQSPVGLVRSEKLDWGLWSVTLDCLYPTPSPWPVSGLNVTGKPRCMLSWGAGGIRREVEFDYPTGGGAFTVNCDALDLRVRATQAEPVAVGVAAQNPVTVGAWLSPSSSPGTLEPMILQEADSPSAGNVPPFARYIVVEPYDPGAPILAAGEVNVKFTDVALNVQSWPTKQYAAGAAQTGTFRARVPPLATRWDLVCTAGTNWSVFWELSFA